MKVCMGNEWMAASAAGLSAAPGEQWLCRSSTRVPSILLPHCCCGKKVVKAASQVMSTKCTELYKLFPCQGS